MSEWDLVSYVKSRAKPHPRLKQGIGDDTAVLAGHPDEILATIDSLMDGVHFLTDTTKPEAIGYKALAVSLSDIAAMGGQAETALLSLSIPKHLSSSWIKRLCDGAFELADSFGVSLCGGDTTSWRGPLVVTTAVYGKPHEKGPLLRSTAKAGQLICVSGPLGGSLNRGRHLKFKPRLHEVKELLDTCEPSSMIDISDGLASDLRHICDLSQCGAMLYRNAIPVHEDAKSENDDTAIRAAMTDGEDFELCFTIPENQRPLLEGLSFKNYVIGKTIEQSGLFWDDASPIHLKGYEHRFA
jgi:thiamine-monophosphate kinase